MLSSIIWLNSWKRATLLLMRGRLLSRILSAARPPSRTATCTSLVPVFPAVKRVHSKVRRSCQAETQTCTTVLARCSNKFPLTSTASPVAPMSVKGRCRSLRQDGAQRYRVCRHAAHWRSLRSAPHAALALTPKADLPTIFESRSGTRANLNSYLIEVTTEVLRQEDAKSASHSLTLLLIHLPEGHGHMDRPNGPRACCSRHRYW